MIIHVKAHVLYTKTVYIQIMNIQFK